MKNEQIQEIIDYLDGGEKFQDLLIQELKNPDLEDYERRTYTSLLDSLLGATELYCAMSEDEEEGNTLNFYKTTIEQANKLLNDGALYLLNPTCEAENEDVQSGIDFTFRLETIGGGFRFRNLLIKTDGTVHISKEY